MKFESLAAIACFVSCFAVAPVGAQGPPQPPPPPPTTSDDTLDSLRLNLPGYTEGDVIVRDFRFRTGEVLPQLRLHYVTLGRPHRGRDGAIDNAILLLHSTGGDTQEFLLPEFADPLFGPGGPLDLNAFYVVIPDAIGHGKSSKPSDGLRAHFPRYDYGDMVDGQHRLLTDHLGVRHLVLVLGLSMGGMHAWLWGERYPDLMDALMPISALPVEVAGRNRLWRRMIIDAIRNDPDWKNGDYTEQPRAYARIRPLVWIMTTNPTRLYERYPTRAAADSFYDQVTQASPADANDRLYQYDASRTYNPAPDLEKINARVLSLVFQDDQINSPQFAALRREMPRVRYGRYVIVAADSTSNGEDNNTKAAIWRRYLRALLGSRHRSGPG